MGLAFPSTACIGEKDMVYWIEGRFYFVPPLCRCGEVIVVDSTSMGITSLKALLPSLKQFRFIPFL